MSRLLILYATSYGQTGKIVRRIASRDQWNTPDGQRRGL